jgi:hypothetical protein
MSIIGKAGQGTVGGRHVPSGLFPVGIIHGLACTLMVVVVVGRWERCIMYVDVMIRLSVHVAQYSVTHDASLCR